MLRRQPAILLSLAAVLVLVLGTWSCTRQVPITEQPPPPPEPASLPAEKPPPKTHLQLWQELVANLRHAPEPERITAVNTFFNRLQFIEDRYQWGESDYWATLLETLALGGGDCEDLTLAKYFSLLHLNIPNHRMRITYVLSVKTRKPHMVLAYFPAAGDEPLVLDTTDNLIFPVSRRPDLMPVYSFNQRGYWLAEKEEGWRGRKIGSASRLSMWRHVLQRMDHGG
jgi:predicted transglutaminase-like cysteine proteinase